MRHFLSYLKKFFLEVYRQLAPNPVSKSEVSSILKVKGAGFLHLSKISFPLNHQNRTGFDLFCKIPQKQKKTVTADKVQTINRPHCLTVTVTRFFVVLRLLPRHYSHSQ